MPSCAPADPLMHRHADAKRFDLLMLRLQLALLRSEASFPAMRDQVREMAGVLQEKSNIPMVQEQLPLIQEIQTDEFWQDVTVVLLELVRKRLRALIKLIERTRRTVVFADFEDELGPESMIALPGFGSGAEFERFRAKARSFLQAHEDHLSVVKLRLNEPLTPNDLDDLEELLIEAGRRMRRWAGRWPTSGSTLRR